MCPSREAKQKQISVIIPTRGRDSSVRAVLRDLNEQSMGPGLFDVYIVDQNEVPLEALAQEAPGIQVHHLPMEAAGSHAGRNLAIGKTDAKLCLFIDDDVRISPFFVEAHVQAHAYYAQELPSVVCVTGRVVQPKDGMTETDMLRQGKLARYNPWTGWVSGNFVGFHRGCVDHLHECNVSIQTSVLRDLGGFNEEFRGNAYFEGADLGLRLRREGFSIAYRPDISVTHLQWAAGGNRVQQKSEHTYWYLRNWSLLNSEYMHTMGLPLFGVTAVGYVLGKAVKNRDMSIAIRGLQGVVDGARYFLPGAQRYRSRLGSGSTET